MTTFVTFRQFCAEHKNATGFKNLTKRLYKKTLSNGSVEDVPGVALVDNADKDICMFALSRELYGKNASDLAGMANELHVAKQEYIAKDDSTKTALILCTGGASSTGETAVFKFAE